MIGVVFCTAIGGVPVVGEAGVGRLDVAMWALYA